MYAPKLAAITADLRSAFVTNIIRKYKYSNKRGYRLLHMSAGGQPILSGEPAEPISGLNTSGKTTSLGEKST